jgi:hypothetical protein
MILMPLLVAIVTIPVIRRLCRREESTQLPDFVIHEKGGGT